MTNSERASDQVPKQELIERIDHFRALMAAVSVDFALIFQNVDRFYFTGTMQKGIVVIPLDQEPMIFIEKGVERARTETPFDVIPVRNDREMGQILDDKGVKKGTAGLELDVLPVSLFERFTRTFGFGGYADITPPIRELRAVKSPFELEQIRKSGAIMSHVFKAARDIIRPGISEIDVEAALIAEGRRHGHHGYLRMRGANQEIMTMVVQAGPNGAVTTFVDGAVPGGGISPAIPQGSSFNKVEPGIPVTVDYCGGYNGYNTDETRPFVAGDLKEMFRKPYETAHAIIEDVMAYGREGVDCTEIYLRAHSMVKKAGLEEYFEGHGDGQVPFIGHGVGLEINDLPVLTPRHHMVLKEGMVFALEPKFVLPPHGAIGIEVDFIVRPNGLERVTKDSFDLVKV